MNAEEGWNRLLKEDDGESMKDLSDTMLQGVLKVAHVAYLRGWKDRGEQPTE